MVANVIIETLFPSMVAYCWGSVCPDVSSKVVCFLLALYSSILLDTRGRGWRMWALFLDCVSVATLLVSGVVTFFLQIRSVKCIRMLFLTWSLQ